MYCMRQIWRIMEGVNLAGAGGQCRYNAGRRRRPPSPQRLRIFFGTSFWRAPEDETRATVLANDITIARTTDKLQQRALAAHCRQAHGCHADVVHDRDGRFP